MSDEIRELRNEIMALKEINDKLEGKNSELKEKNYKLEEEIKELKAEKSQQNSTGTSSALQPIEISDKSAPLNNERPKRPRFIQNWLIDSLSWIGRKELANSSLSTSCETFRQLCWPKLHQNEKPRKIQYLEIFPAQCELGNMRALVRRLDKKIIPIASIPPLNYIAGIWRIDLKFVDDQVVNFIKSIDNLLQYGNLELNPFNQNKMDKKLISSLRILLEFLAKKLSFNFELNFRWQSVNDFNRVFPGLLDHVQFLRLWEFILDSENIDILLNWVARRSINGNQTFILLIHPGLEPVEILNNRIKGEFSKSNSPIIFFIYFHTAKSFKNVEEFTLENTSTNEILTFYRKIIHETGESYHCIARYPKEEENWKKDGEIKIENELWKRDSTFIYIDI